MEDRVTTGAVLRFNMEINPQYLGFIHFPYDDAFVYCYGMTLDPADVVIKTILAGTIGEIEKIKKTGTLRAKFTPSPTATNRKSLDVLIDMEHSTVTEIELGERKGRALVISHGAGLQTSEPVAIGDFTHLYVWGHMGTLEPDEGNLIATLQKFGEKAILPEWLPAIWKRLIDKKAITCCKNLGGFGPAWEIVIDPHAWDKLYAACFKAGEFA